MYDHRASPVCKLTCLAITMTLFQVSELSKGRDRRRAGRASALRAQQQHHTISTASRAHFIFPNMSISSEHSYKSDHLNKQLHCLLSVSCGKQHNPVVYIELALAQILSKRHCGVISHILAFPHLLCSFYAPISTSDSG